MRAIKYTFKEQTDVDLIRFLWRATNPNCLYSKEFKLAIRAELLKRKEVIK